MAEDKTHKLVRYLNDTYAAEMGGNKSLEALNGSAKDPDLKTLTSSLMEQTQRSADRLEQRITALGGSPSGGKSVVDQAVALGSHILNAFHDDADKQTQDTIKMVAYKAFQVGAYVSLETYAKAINDSETASLAQSLMSEKQQAEQSLLKLIPQLAHGAAMNAA